VIERKKADRYLMWAMFAFLGIVAWHVAQPLWACPACKDAVEQASNGGTLAAESPDSTGFSGGGNLAKGFFWSILTMARVAPHLVSES